MSKSQPRVPLLELVQDDQVLRVVEVTESDFFIGRATGLNLHLEETKVSRNHARIERKRDGGHYLLDLDSHNKTYLDGIELKPYRPTLLRDGSRIKIVDIELVFRTPEVTIVEQDDDHATVLGTLADLSSNSLTERLAEPARALASILELNRALGGGGNLNDTLSRVLESLMTVFPRAERGFILTAEPDGSFPLCAARERTQTTKSPSMSRTIMRMVMTRGEAVLISNAIEDERFQDTRSVATMLRTALCVPLPGHDGRPVGMIQLDSRVNGDVFTASELCLLAAMAIPVGVAVENRRLLKLQASWAAASEIQLALLPKSRPDIPGYEFWEYYRPAQEVGGDLYDYIRIDPEQKGTESRWGIMVADACGKGMPAALMIATVRPEIRHYLGEGLAPDEVLSRTNHRFIESDFLDRFVTLILTEIDARTHTLSVANAGHPCCLIRRSRGAIEELGLDGKGFPLGIDESAVYQTVETTLEPGDVVVLYTDGATDAMNVEGKIFHDLQLRRVISEAPKGVAAVGEAITSAIAIHAAGRSQFDDITLVCFGRV